MDFSDERSNGFGVAMEESSDMEIEFDGILNNQRSVEESSDMQIEFDGILNNQRSPVHTETLPPLPSPYPGLPPMPVYQQEVESIQGKAFFPLPFPFPDFPHMPVYQPEHESASTHSFSTGLWDLNCPIRERETENPSQMVTLSESFDNNDSDGKENDSFPEIINLPIFNCNFFNSFEDDFDDDFDFFK